MLLTDPRAARQLSIDREFVALLADVEGGHATLNEIRVLYTVLLRFALRKPAYVGRMAKELGMPRSTVSRAVIDCMAKGQFRTKRDPEDSRRWLVLPSPRFQSEMAGFLEAVDRLRSESGLFDAAI